jgi:PhnB protein
MSVEQRLTAYLSAKDAAKAIEFYRAVFDAELVGEPYLNDDGTIGHSELRIAGTLVMLAGEHPVEGVISPDTAGGTTVQMVLAVDDPEAVVERAQAAGATLLRPVADAHGGRAGKIKDPFGHNWFVSAR